MISEWPEDNILIAYRDGVGLFSPKISKVLSKIFIYKKIINKIVKIKIKFFRTPLGIFMCVVPILDLITDYLGTNQNLSKNDSSVSRALGYAMLLNLLMGPVVTGKIHINILTPTLSEISLLLNRDNKHF